MAFWTSYPPYVPQWKRKQQAEKAVAKLKKKGEAVAPIVIKGRVIASTFWGKSWCDHIESFSDYDNRLPRGRTYVRNGSVIDLQISEGRVKALVSGSSLYKIEIGIKKLSPKAWQGIVARCAGQIDSLVELLEGKLSRGIMDVVASKREGLFPSACEISLKCSCPDSAGLCKHLAAVFYGIGARLDAQPELLFKLRGVDHMDLISEGAQATAKLTKRSSTAGSKSKRRLGSGDASDLSALFGVDLKPVDANQPSTYKNNKKKSKAGKQGKAGAKRKKRN